MRRLLTAQTLGGMAALPGAAQRAADRTATPASPAQADPAVQVRAEVFATGLETPWGMSFAPDGRLFVTERAGRVRVVERGRLRPTPWATLPVAFTRGAGLLGIAVAPDFARSRAVYVAATFPAAGGGLENRVVRLTDRAGVGVAPTTILTGLPAFQVHAGSAVAFGPDRLLYVTVGDARQPERVGTPGWLGATILRVRPDGTVPRDNPVPGSPVYATGLRNAQGLAWLADGALFATDHGPSGWPGERGLRHRDELNEIRAGANYGWPRAAGLERADGATPPLTEWTPAIAPSGLAAYTGPVAAWRGSLFVGALWGRQLRRVALARGAGGRHRVTAEEPLLADSLGRVRAVAMGPDGFLYVTTSNRELRDPRLPAAEDRVLRLIPVVGATPRTSPPQPGVRP